MFEVGPRWLVVWYFLQEALSGSFVSDLQVYCFVSIPHIKEEIWSKREIGFKRISTLHKEWVFTGFYNGSEDFCGNMSPLKPRSCQVTDHVVLLGYPVAEHLANDLKDAGTLRQPLGSIPSWASVFSSTFIFVGDCHLASLELGIEFDICGRVGWNILASPFGEALLFNLIPFFWEWTPRCFSPSTRFASFFSGRNTTANSAALMFMKPVWELEAQGVSFDSCTAHSKLYATSQCSGDPIRPIQFVRRLRYVISELQHCCVFCWTWWLISSDWGLQVFPVGCSWRLKRHVRESQSQIPQERYWCCMIIYHCGDGSGWGFHKVRSYVSFSTRKGRDPHVDIRYDPVRFCAR